MSVVAKAAIAVGLALLLPACGDAEPPASGPRAEADAGSPRVSVGLTAEACALTALPVETQEQRADMGQRAGDITRRYNGTLGPKSDIPFLLAGMTTLAQVPVGQSFFGTALPAPTLAGGFVPPGTLEEALEALDAECSRLR